MRAQHVNEMSMGLKRHDVEMAYELMLGRAAENSSVIVEHLEAVTTVEQLRKRFMGSREFHEKVQRDLGIAPRIALDAPKMRIEVDVAPETLGAMLRHIERNWAALGANEPHWSVLTNEKFKSAAIEEHKAEFYESGKRTISYFTQAAERGEVDYKELRTCFELGCGVGRLSVWLGEIFPEVIAADISSTHLRIAEEVVRSRGLESVEFRLVDTIDKINSIPAFDCFISIIVLQHNPPPVIAFLLRTILGKLNPGGLAYFQVPTYKRDAIFEAERYLEKATLRGMEVHAIPQVTVWKIAEECNCQVVDVREDGWPGNYDYVSNSILLSKRR